jgi:hypothetical protein
MIITLPYEVGQTLWLVDFFSYSREIECLKCKQGKVILLDGSELRCGLCYGRGTHIVSFPYKGRPVQVKITGFDIHNKNGQLETWWYTDKKGNFSYTHDFVETFLEARVKARELNKKYGWPKENYQRDPVFEKSKMFWGYRVGKNKIT